MRNFNCHFHFFKKINSFKETQEQINTFRMLGGQVELLDLDHINTLNEGRTKFINYNNKILKVLTDNNGISNSSNDMVESEEDIHNLQTLKETS